MHFIVAAIHVADHFTELLEAIELVFNTDLLTVAELFLLISMPQILIVLYFLYRVEPFVDYFDAVFVEAELKLDRGQVTEEAAVSARVALERPFFDNNSVVFLPRF
jgi:hypothetical protein